MGFEQLKERQRAIWGSGAFERMERRIADMHHVLIDRLQPPGEPWLDGCGAGGVAFLAAEAGVLGQALELDTLGTRR